MKCLKPLTGIGFSWFQPCNAQESQKLLSQTQRQFTTTVLTLAVYQLRSPWDNDMIEYAAMDPQAWGWGRKSEERLVPSLRKYAKRNSNTRTKAISSFECEIAGEQRQDTHASQALGRYSLTDSTCNGFRLYSNKEITVQTKTCSRHVLHQNTTLHLLPHQKSPFTKRRGSLGFLALSWPCLQLRPKCWWDLLQKLKTCKNLAWTVIQEAHVKQEKHIILETNPKNLKQTFYCPLNTFIPSNTVYGISSFLHHYIDSKVTVQDVNRHDKVQGTVALKMNSVCKAKITSKKPEFSGFYFILELVILLALCRNRDIDPGVGGLWVRLSHLGPVKALPLTGCVIVRVMFHFYRALFSPVCDTE